MRKISLFLFIIGFIFAGCRNKSGESGQQEYAMIVFNQNIYDYGEIDYGSDGMCSFEFTNTSKIPLVINKVTATCGCTTPEWPRSPIKPGESGVIRVGYKTDITGAFRKSLSVYSNALDSPMNLFIRGTVLPENNIK